MPSRPLGEGLPALNPHIEGAPFGEADRRRELGDGIQALCFFAGANSIFYGDRLLTTGNPDVDADRALFARLDLTPLPPSVA